MHFRALIFGHGPWHQRFGWANRQLRRRQPQQGRSSTTASSSSGANAGTNGARGSYMDRVKGWQGPWKAGLTSGSLSACGDLLAQMLQGQMAKKQGKQAPAYDPSRTLRMFGFGLLLYGPYQFYWYNLLEWLMPVKTTSTFLAKVAANQLLLGPVTLSTVFTWNLALTGQSHLISHKIANDLLPTMINGWKFWVPAASINFYAIPLEYQVLYMSACGVLWTAYLSYASVTQMAEPAATPAAVAAAPANQGKKKK